MAVALDVHAKPTHIDSVYEQFEDLEQQQESYIVGMWTFLVTEVMFFGALFLIYTLYRFRYQQDFFLAHEELSVMWGGINTFNLLISSFLMALAVHFAQLRKKKAQLACLAGVLACAFGFMVIKAIEYSSKFEHHLFPGPDFHWSGEGNANVMQLFYGLYFTMTGLHGLHVVIGILVISVLFFLVLTDNKLITDYIPTELIGLYWHFVDIVWIFLFPLFYLIPPLSSGGH